MRSQPINFVAAYTHAPITASARLFQSGKFSARRFYAHVLGFRHQIFIRFLLLNTGKTLVRIFSLLWLFLLFLFSL